MKETPIHGFTVHDFSYPHSELRSEKITWKVPEGHIAWILNCLLLWAALCPAPQVSCPFVRASTLPVQCQRVFHVTCIPASCHNCSPLLSGVVYFSLCLINYRSCVRMGDTGRVGLGTIRGFRWPRGYWGYLLWTSGGHCAVPHDGACRARASGAASPPLG